MMTDSLQELYWVPANGAVQPSRLGGMFYMNCKQTSELKWKNCSFNSFGLTEGEGDSWLPSHLNLSNVII